jgi:WD40 repeat protein
MTNVSGQLHAMLHDGCRFVLEFYQIIKRSALHVYYSALTLSPIHTGLFQRYSTDIHDRMITVGGVETGWNLQLAVLRGHSNLVQSVAFSSDGNRLVSTSRDRTARLWDSTTGALIATLEGSSSSCVVKFSPNGAKLAYCCGNIIGLLDGVTGSSLTMLESERCLTTSVTFSPDGARLASDGDSVKLWDGTTGVLVTELGGSALDLISFSPDATRLAYIPRDHRKTVSLWDGATGPLVAILEGHSQSVNTYMFSSRCQLASASDDKSVKLWNGETGTLVASLEHSCAVNSAVFSPDGARIASGAIDDIIRL